MSDEKSDARRQIHGIEQIKEVFANSVFNRKNVVIKGYLTNLGEGLNLTISMIADTVEGGRKFRKRYTDEFTLTLLEDTEGYAISKIATISNDVILSTDSTEAT